MISIRRTRAFIDWLQALRDRRAVARIAVRIDRLTDGNPGQVRDVGEGISEIKIDYGPGYRVYYITRGAEVVVLLCSGDKGSQERDIGKARRLAREVRDGGQGN